MMTRYPWFARQEWHHILFCHWPVAHHLLQPLIPSPFSIDTFKGQAWLTIVLFKATSSRFRAMPKKMSFPPFMQLNVRTYVHLRHKPGVYFFSLDVNNFLAVFGARLFSLPFMQAKMSMQQDGSGISASSYRIHKEMPFLDVRATYVPKKKLQTNVHALAQWLTERYRFYFIHRGCLIKGSLSHTSWELYDVKTHLNIKGRIGPINFATLKSPLVFYADNKEAFLHPFEKLGIIDL